MNTYVLSDETKAEGPTGRRWIEGALVVAERRSVPGLAGGMAEWERSWSPRKPSGPSGFEYAFFSRDLAPNRGHEPKWASLNYHLGNNLASLAAPGGAAAWFAPLGDLLRALAAAKPHGIRFSDVPLRRDNDPVPHRQHMGALLRAPTGLGLAGQGDIHLHPDRQHYGPLRANLLADACHVAMNQHWATATGPHPRSKASIKPGNLSKRFAAAAAWCLQAMVRPQLTGLASTLFAAALPEAEALGRPLDATAHDRIGRRLLPIVAPSGHRQRSEAAEELAGELATYSELHSFLRSNRFTGPNQLDTEVAPAMIAVDFLCGLYAFFAHTSARFLDQRTRVPVALPSAIRSDIQAALGLDPRRPFVEALAGALDAPVVVESA